MRSTATSVAIISVSASSWLSLILLGAQSNDRAICGSLSLGALFGPSGQIAFLWRAGLIAPLLISWLAMILAMMLPVAAIRMPVSDGSVLTLTLRSQLVFLVWTCAPWIAVIPVLTIVASIMSALVPDYNLATLYCLGSTLVWPKLPRIFGPIRSNRRCRNTTTDNLATLSPMGLGVKSGISCVSRCWPTMLWLHWVSASAWITLLAASTIWFEAIIARRRAMMGLPAETADAMTS